MCADDPSVVGNLNLVWRMSAHDNQHLPCMARSPHAHWVQSSAEKGLSLLHLATKRQVGKSQPTFLHLSFAFLFSFFLTPKGTMPVPSKHSYTAIPSEPNSEKEFQTTRRNAVSCSTAGFFIRCHIYSSL